MKLRLPVIFIVVLVTIGLITGCRNATTKNDVYEDVLRKNVDTTVSPGKDFFKYANGTWLKNNPIPESESRWGIANLVQEETYTRLREISEQASKDQNAKQGTALQKIGDFYFTGMDSIGIEKNGLAPLKPELERIDNIANVKELTDVIALYKTYQIGVLFDLPIYQDQMNSDKMALYVTQGGLGLPNRDYYFNKDARTENIRKEYLIHLTKMFELLGEDSITAKKNSTIIMTIETNLATKSRKLEELRDPYKNYNKMAIDKINKMIPSVNWKDLLVKIGVSNPDTVIVGQPEFLKEVESLLKSVSIQDWKTYLRWHLINAFADKLSTSFDNEDFNFYGRVLEGKQVQRARWKRVLDAEENGMGELLGQLYVEKYFSVATKRRYENLVDNIMEVFKERIKKLDWMSPATKEKSFAKLATVVKKVGYPDKWKDYSQMTIKRDSYFNNVLQTNVWAFNYQLNKLGKPVDRTEWDMTPQTYNAYYNPSNNEIVLPAAIFIIPGMPDSLADDAVVYSYAGGSTIGHELIHGFDDEGKQYDAKGNLSNWWTKEDEKKFNERSKVMEKQFNDYVVLDNMHVNGKACLGENIADLAGVLLGYDAFKKTQQSKEGKLIAGFTPDQRYFLGYALSWLGHQRDERLARQILTDVHSPAFLRINGPLSDIPTFYEAFGVKQGDPMYREEKVRVNIW